MEPNSISIYNTFPVPVDLPPPTNNRRELADEDPYEEPPELFRHIPQVAADPLPDRDLQPAAQNSNPAVQKLQEGQRSTQNNN